MTLNDFIESALEMEQNLLMEAVEDLAPEELTWQPESGANPMGWMLWHTIRVEDMWVQFFIQGQIEIWEREGWNNKFGLPTRDNGFGHTAEQVAGFPALDLQELLRYGRAVRAGTLEHLRGLSPEDFDHVPRERRPNLTVGSIYRQLLGEFFQHQGQIAYLKGLKRGAGALPPTYATPG